MITPIPNYGDFKVHINIQKINDNPLLNTTFSIAAGVVIAVFVSLIFSNVKPIWVFLVPIGLLIFLPTFIVKEVKLYWLTLFLFALQFDIKKHLLDGYTVLDSLGIDYVQFVYLPTIYISDLPLLMLFALWAHKLYTRKARIYFPPISYFVLGYIGWSALSLFKAPFIYLGVIELLRQCKFFFIYLYVANNINSKRIVKLVLVVLVLSIVLQGVVTVGRYKLQFYEPIFGNTFGRAQEISEDDIKQLVVYPTKDEETKSSYGTLSHGDTSRFLMFVLPIAFMLCGRNPLLFIRWIFFPIFLLGSTALYLTYSRVALVVLIFEIMLCYYFGLRRGYISKKMGLTLLFLVIFTSLAIIPQIYSHMDRKYENITNRLEQYETTISMIRSNPILGVGLNNSTQVSIDYSEADESKGTKTHPIHSFYLVLLSEIGIVGFILYFSFFILICRKALLLSRSSHDPEIAFFSTIIFVTLFGLAVGVLANPFFEDLMNKLLWLYAGIIVAFARKEEKENALNQG